jgi:hypothetical protein
MPYERPGQGYYAVATKVTNHGAACVEDGVVGVAIKQKASSWQAAQAAQNQIGIGEAFHIRTKGIRQVATVGGATKGAMVWIVKATNALQLTATGASAGYKFGVVVELAGQRGTPTGYMRVDLDLKDQTAT